MANLIELLRRHQVPFRTEGHHHCRAGWIQVDCPYCAARGSESFHMGWNIHFNYVNCWRCGRHDLLETLTRLSGLSWREAKQELSSVDSKSIPKVDRPSGKLQVPKGVGPLLKAHKRYLRGRGFDPGELERLWNLQGIGIARRLQWRVFVPIYLRDRMVSWTSRAIADTGLRYVSASVEEEAISHKSLLYGEHYCRHSIIIVEGPADVWTIGPGAVGTCGTGYSIQQLKRMAKYPVRAICFDNQPIAQARARELCAQLECYPGDTYNVTLDGKDANEASERDIKKLRKAFLR